MKRMVINRNVKFFISAVLLILLGYGKGYPLNHEHFQAVKKCLFIRPSIKGKMSKAEKNDQASLKGSIYVSGIPMSEMPVDSLSEMGISRYDLVVIPLASAKSLSAKQVTQVMNAIRKGAHVVTDGISKLSAALGIQFEKEPITVRIARDMNYPDIPLYWQPKGTILTVDTSGARLRVICREDSLGRAIEVKGTLGKGGFLYFSTYFDPNTNQGYSRFPFLVETLHEEFDIHPLAERKAVEMYFDPGMRDTVPISKLVKYWKQNKIKRIHAGGWYFDEDFDYGELIRECHANGIVVYCWLETPMISLSFWNNHPEWREKTVYNKDAHIDWRYLINLADPACRKEIFKELGSFLQENDFDGVNLAELYFEPSPVGPNLPENFTPMNAIVRGEFKKLSGFDPVELFDPNGKHFWKNNSKDWKEFANYRKDLCYRLKQHFLDFLDGIRKKKPGLEIMLTPLDVSLTADLSDYIGEDTQNTLKLYRKYNLTLQVEDPSSCWGLMPTRYDRMGKYYRQFVKGPNQLLFDCNVVSSHEQGEGGFAAEKPTGEEIRQVTYNMARNINRPVFYSEDAFTPHDFVNISNTLAYKTKIRPLADNVWMISADKTVIVHTGVKEAPLKLDGKTWCAGQDNEVIIPSGKHRLEIANPGALKTPIQILRISGELITAKFANNLLELTYSEDFVSCYLTLEVKPSIIEIDGHKADCQVYANNDHEFSIKLPAGIHRVRITGK